MKVLIVDDEPFCHELIKRTLESVQIQTVSAHNVDDAICAMEEQDFDVVITDIIMPLKHGTALIQHIREKGDMTPVIAITAGFENATADYINHAEMFADKAISKPFVKSDLIEMVQSLAAENRC